MYFSGYILTKLLFKYLIYILMIQLFYLINLYVNKFTRIIVNNKIL